MKKLLRRAKRFKGVTVGLDLHKRQITYSVLSGRGDEKDKGVFASGREELGKFVEKWKSRGAVQFAIEACGCFLWAHDFLKELVGKENVHVAQPSKVKVIATSQEKTDATDAWWLAYLLYEGRLPEAHVAEGMERDLRIAERELRACVDGRSDIVRRMNSHFAQAGIRIPKSFHTSRKKRAEVREKLRELTGERRIACRRLFARIVKMGREEKYWRKRMEKLCGGLVEVKTARRELPGFGPVISATVYGEMGDGKRYHSAKAFARATGLTPGYRESAGWRRGCGIVRAGNGRARWAFTQAARACLRCRKGPGRQVKAWIEEHTRNGRRKRAIVAAGRKLAEAYWRLFQDGETFDVTKAFPVKVTPRPAKKVAG